MGASVAVLAFSCLALGAHAAIEKPAHSFTVEEDAIILADCFVVQGNGYQWGTSLSYLAEALSVRARDAFELKEQSEKKVYLYDSCVIGGSSGSASVGVYMNLFRNLDIVENRELILPKDLIVNGVNLGKVRVYDPDDMNTLSRLLRFIAMGTDFTAKELLFFLPRVVSGQLGLVHDNVPNWWRQNMDPYAAQVLFAEHALMIRNAKRSDIDVSVKDALDETKWIIGPLLEYAREIGFASDKSSTGADFATDYLKHSEKEIPEDSDKLLKYMNKWANEAGHDINERVYKDAGAHYGTRLLSNIDADTPINDMFKEPLADGVCTMAFAVPFDDIETLKQRKRMATYDEAKPFVACNAKTIQIILNSEEYRKDVKAKLPFILDYKFVAVNTYYEAYNFGIREPGVFQVLSGEMAADLGMTNYYDPAKDTSHTFEMSATDGTGSCGTPALAVLGGYGTAEMMAIPNSYLAMGIFEALEITMPSGQVVMNQERIGKDSEFPNVFAREVIRKMLCGPLKHSDYERKYEENLAKWDDRHAFFVHHVPEKVEKMSDRMRLFGSTINWKSLTLLPSTGDGTTYAVIPRAIPRCRATLERQRFHKVRDDIYCPSPKGTPEGACEANIPDEKKNLFNEDEFYGGCLEHDDC